ncbi:MAG: aldolase [Euzebyales bacterium]|nr:aldolase [Euzebyales bacterium]
MTTLPDDALGDLFARIEEAAAGVAAAYPGDHGGRQPVSTLYVPADRCTATTAPEYGAEALRLLDAHAPDPADLEAIGVPAELAATVRERVAAKLAAEPVEDLRIDFEDGYGARPDAEEDSDAARAAGAVATALADGALPPFVGLRVKSFADGLHRRSARTLDVFLTALLEATGGTLPPGFVVTFPKIVATAHVGAFAELLGRLEAALGLVAGTLRFEAQVETTQSIVAADGRLALRGMVAAAGGRLSGAHFGTYDYTAACGLLAAQQRLTHPACDFARHVMQTALAGTGVRLADGSTNAVPEADTAPATRAAWTVHARHVTHSLRHGFFQGWDLHPAHLPSRYAAVYAFLLADLDAVRARLAGTAAGVLDEPATLRQLRAHLARAVDCGAIDPAEVAGR